MLGVVRVLIVDDSVTSRAALARLIRSGAGMEIAAEVGTGEQAVRAVKRLKPDIVLMDVVMHEMDGLTATRRIMSESPVPVLVISDVEGASSAMSFQALEAGAMDFVRKPSRAELDDPRFCARFCRMVRGLAKIPVVTRSPHSEAGRRGAEPISTRGARALERRPPGRGFARVCVGASTGGPPALRALLQTFGARPPWPILIVQHITPGFTGSLASWLAAETGVEVELAKAGAIPIPGAAYLAPDGANLVFQGGALALTTQAKSGLHMPSIDALFRSIVSSGSAGDTLAVLLTGMGNDGAAGLRAIREAGGYTIAQDEGTSVVYGMPRAAIERDAAIEVLPLCEIGPRLLALSSPGAAAIAR